MNNKIDNVSTSSDTDKCPVSGLTENKSISWLDLSAEELLKVTDVSVCMYGKQSSATIN